MQATTNHKISTNRLKSNQIFSLWVNFIIHNWYSTFIIFVAHCAVLWNPQIFTQYIWVLRLSTCLSYYSFTTGSLLRKNNKKFLSLKLKYQILSQVQQHGTSFMIFDKFYQIYYNREWKQVFILECIAFWTFEKSKFSYCL